jgi:ribosomal protein L44E
MALPELNTARYKVEVPSTGQEISYRPYLVKEEKLLMMAMESNDSKVIMQTTIDIIKACVFDDIDVESLAMFDIETLFLALRSKSVGEKIDLNIKCEECQHGNEVQIDFDAIEAPVVTDDNKQMMLTDTVGVVLKYPSVKDIDSLSNLGDNEMDAAMSMLVACIDSIFDEDNVYDAKSETTKELTNFVESLNSEQFQNLSEFFGSMPALSSLIEFNCTSCGKANSQELKGLQSFFT